MPKEKEKCLRLKFRSMSQENRNSKIVEFDAISILLEILGPKVVVDKVKLISIKLIENLRVKFRSQETRNSKMVEFDTISILLDTWGPYDELDQLDEIRN